MREHGVWRDDAGVYHKASDDKHVSFSGATYCGNYGTFEIECGFPTCLKCIDRDRQYRTLRPGILR